LDVADLSVAHVASRAPAYLSGLRREAREAGVQIAMLALYSDFTHPDATERRRQRPKNPDKQALFYSGRKKQHCDKNVVIVNTREKRIDYLSRTYPGKTHEKKIADEEGISYPPGATLYKDTEFQGYEPAVKKTCQAKKKAAPRRAHRG